MSVTHHKKLSGSHAGTRIKREGHLIWVERNKIEISTHNTHVEIKRISPRKYVVRDVLFENWSQTMMINGVSHEFDRCSLVHDRELESSCAGIKKLMKGVEA